LRLTLPSPLVNQSSVGTRAAVEHVLRSRLLHLRFCLVAARMQLGMWLKLLSRISHVLHHLHLCLLAVYVRLDKALGLIGLISCVHSRKPPRTTSRIHLKLLLAHLRFCHFLSLVHLASGIRPRKPHRSLFQQPKLSRIHLLPNRVLDTLVCSAVYHCKPFRTREFVHNR
jgi:hypothetical protein